MKSLAQTLPCSALPTADRARLEAMLCRREAPEVDPRAEALREHNERERAVDAALDRTHEVLVRVCGERAPSRNGWAMGLLLEHLRALWDAARAHR